MLNEPRVSIVIPTRNRSQWLERNLLAVKGQDFDAFEVIVVDDGSSQDHLDSYAALKAKLDDRFIFQFPVSADAPGTGPSAARNRGITAARGEYIAFCDDDDYWDAKDHLSLAVQTMDQEQADLYFANMRGLLGDEVKIPEWFPDCPSLRQGKRVHETHAIYQVQLPALMHAMASHYPHLNTVVIRGTTLQKAGMFWERIRFAEDVNLLLRVADISRKILFRDEPVPVFNLSPRESAFSCVTQMEQALTSIHMTQHAYALTRQPSVKRCARQLESWQYRRLADLLREQGSSSHARTFAWRAWACLPSLGNAKQLVRHMLRG